MPPSNAAEEPIWAKYRDQFPVTRQFVYLNHASISPLCRPAAEAMTRFIQDASNSGSLHYDEWLATYEGLRRSAARLINADKNEIAIVKNTSEGIATLALGLDWRPGDKIVAFREEFPANSLPWKRLESQGVSIEWLSCSDPFEKIDSAARGARLLTVSFVQFLTGHRADLQTLGEICARHETLFFVDAIQGLGAFPLDVRSARIHALAADGHKWLLGPEGCGILYVQQDLQDSVEPAEFGWTNVVGAGESASGEIKLRPDAARYECGTLNTVGCFGLRAAIDFLVEVGIEPISHAVLSLADAVAEGVLRKRYELLAPRAPESSAGIVSFRRYNADSRLIVRNLKEKGFLAAPRRGWVRVSPHFYLSPQEIESFLQALP